MSNNCLAFKITVIVLHLPSGNPPSKSHPESPTYSRHKRRSTIVTEINLAPICSIGAEIKGVVSRAEYRKTSGSNITRSPNNEPKRDAPWRGVPSSVLGHPSSYERRAMGSVTFSRREKNRQSSHGQPKRREKLRDGGIREREIVCVFVPFVVSHRDVEVPGERGRRNGRRRRRGAGQEKSRSHRERDNGVNIFARFCDLPYSLPYRPSHATIDKTIPRGCGSRMSAGR